MSVILVREGVIMKIGIVGSRNLVVSNLDEYVLEECTEIISGGAIGVDKCAADYAKSKNKSSDEPVIDLYYIADIEIELTKSNCRDKDLHLSVSVP